MNFSFTDLVGDEKEFFAEYFNKKPMLRKNSLSGDPRELLSVKKLDELVHLEVIRPPYIKVNLNGNGVHEQGYTRSTVVQGYNVTDSVVPEKIYELFRAGGTVTWSSLNQVVPEMREFSRIIADKVTCRTDTVAFMTPAGRKGYPPHHDPVELFIVQLEGTKKWKLWNPPAVRHGDNASYTLEQLGDPVIEVTLEPGDVLYLPYNTPHAAEAEGQVSLHLSVMMRPRMWNELLRLSVEQLLKDPEFNEYPHIGAFRTEDAEEAFTAKLATLAGKLTALGSPELDRLAELGRTMPGSSHGDVFSRIAEADSFAEDTPLRRGPAAVEFGPANDGRAQLSVNGHKVAVPASVAERLADLGADSFATAADIFPGVPAERSTSAAKGLARLGVLELASN